MHILPHLEQQNLYAQIDFTQYVDTPAYEAMAETIISSYICPSDENAGVPLLEERGDSSANNRKKYNPAASAGLWYVASIGPTKPDAGNPLCETPEGIPSYCNIGCSFGTAGADRVITSKSAQSF